MLSSESAQFFCLPTKHKIEKARAVLKQVPQLLQRDCAAGWVMAKSIRLELGDNIYGYYKSYIQPMWHIWSAKQSNSVKKRKRVITRSSSFKVIEVSTNRKPVCNFLLVINSNWQTTCISYRCGVIAAYCSNFGHFAFLSHPLGGGGETIRISMSLSVSVTYFGQASAELVRFTCFIRALDTDSPTVYTSLIFVSRARFVFSSFFSFWIRSTSVIHYRAACDSILITKKLYMRW